MFDTENIMNIPKLKTGQNMDMDQNWDKTG